MYIVSGQRSKGMTFHFKIGDKLQAFTKKITEKGKLFVVGGAVRDTLLGRNIKDVDLATDLLPSEVETIVKELGLIRVMSTRDFEHGIIRFADPDAGHVKLVDIATLRKDDSCDGRHAQVSFTKDIQEDLQRRDLTINAMAIEIDHTGKEIPLKTPLGGLWLPHQPDHKPMVDLDEKVIRFVGVPEQRIQEDHLRMLRACRFMALGKEWKMGGTDEQAIVKHAELIKTVSKERIYDEFIKALGYPCPSNFFRALQKCGLLKHLMPDLELGVGCLQNKHHRDDVFEHLMLTLDAATELSQDPIFRLAAVTHDIAKPHTKAGNGDNCTFHKHEVVGASLIYDWMRLYKFPKDDCEYVSKMVRHHMFHFEDDTKDKAIRKFLQEVGKYHWRDLFTLRLADRKGNRAKAGRSEIPRKVQELTERIEGMLADGTPIFKEDLALDGKDFIELGVKPGPIFKDIFSNLLGIVIADPAKNTREWCTQYVKKNYVDKHLNVQKEETTTEETTGS